MITRFIQGLAFAIGIILAGFFYVVQLLLMWAAILLLPVFIAVSCIPKADAADVSLYRGLATTHLMMDNSDLNNDNGVTIVKIDAVFAGFMTNSYGEPGQFIGFQPTWYSNGRWDVAAGLAVVNGYRRWQLPFLPTRNYEHSEEKVLAMLPVMSVGYEVREGFVLQLNNMSGVVMNAGIRIDL